MSLEMTPAKRVAVQDRRPARSEPDHAVLTAADWPSSFVRTGRHPAPGDDMWVRLSPRAVTNADCDIQPAIALLRKTAILSSERFKRERGRVSCRA